MCLTIYSKVKPKPSILEKERKVFKVLRVYGNSFRTPYRKYEMQEGEHYYQTKQKFTITDSYFMEGEKPYNISVGLHAYTSYKRARNRLSYNEIIVEMYLPIGTEFFENTADKEIVADNLIWYKGAKIYNPNKLKIK